MVNVSRRIASVLAVAPGTASAQPLPPVSERAPLFWVWVAVGVVLLAALALLFLAHRPRADAARRERARRMLHDPRRVER